MYTFHLAHLELLYILGFPPGLFFSAACGSVFRWSDVYAGRGAGWAALECLRTGPQLEGAALSSVPAWLPNVLFLLCPQYLFVTFPRIVFMLGFVVMLSLLLGGYLCFALYLAATNQTTNEWYRGDRAWCQHCPHAARPPSAEPQVYRNIHSHGLWSNLREIFLPATAHYERKKN